MSVEQNKAVVHRFIEEVLNGKHINAVDGLLADNFVEHEQLPPGFPEGKEGPKAMFAMAFEAFPDLNANIVQTIAEGDKVVIYMNWTGTHKGEFMGIPATGNTFSINVIDIFEVTNGSIVGHWGATDMMGLMQQLGVMEG